jgi:hypothetical protein
MHTVRVKDIEETGDGEGVLGDLQSRSLTWIISIRMLENFFVTLSRRMRNPMPANSRWRGITTTPGPKFTTFQKS